MPPEPSDRFGRANWIFAEALRCSEPERGDFIRRHSADDAMSFEVLAMLERYEAMNGFLAEPLIGGACPSSEIPNGEILSSRFRILEFIGRGGMGEVYRASDNLTGAIVALKVLRSGIPGGQNAEERFRQELTLARKVSHPNICRIHELFAHADSGGRLLYLTMEYVEGETLADKLRAGPLPHDRILNIARQTADGLDAAHRAGIVHRDLKPSNILLSEERAVITDFGLARSYDKPESESGVTLTGQAPGTPAYMSPEQFTGAKLTPRSDVFTFGLIVFEMLAGRHPFPREDVALGLQSSSGTIPRGWDRVIARALASAPEGRYASAGAMVRDMERGRSIPPAPIRMSRRGMIWAGAGVAMSAFAAILRLKDWSVTLPSSPVIMLTPVTNSSDALTAKSLDVLLSGQLTQSAHIRLLSAAERDQAWQRISGVARPAPAELEPAAARDIALRQGADFVLFGNLGKTGDEYALRLRLELMGADPAHAKKTWSRDFSAQNRQDLPSAVFDGISWVRTMAGESAADLQKRSRRPEEMTTTSFQALREFTEADDAWSKRDAPAAMLHLHTALDLDPGFALAAFRTADILTATNHNDEAIPYYKSASDLIRRKNLTDRESLRIRGLFLQDMFEDEEAERVFARWTLEYPRDPLPLFYRATSLDRLGRFDEALLLGRRASELDPHRPVFVEATAERLLNMGRIDESRVEAQRFAAMNPSDWSDILASALAMADADLAGVWNSLEHLSTAGSPRFRSLSYTYKACFRAEQSRWSDAEELYRKGLEFDASQALDAEAWIKKRQLAQMALRQGDKRKSRSECAKLLTPRLPAGQTMEIGCVLAQAGDVEGARACLRPAVSEFALYRRWSLRLQGEIAVAEGNPSRGLELVLKAPAATPGLWREDIFRAAVAARDGGALRTALTDLFTNPGRAWRLAQLASPGFLNRAAAIASKLTLADRAGETAARLKAQLAEPSST